MTISCAHPRERRIVVFFAAMTSAWNHRSTHMMHRALIAVICCGLIRPSTKNVLTICDEGKVCAPVGYIAADPDVHERNGRVEG